MTVKEFRNDVLIKALYMVDPDVMIDGKGVIVISSEEGETDCNNDKLLKDMSIVDGCILVVDDFFQNYTLNITIFHKDVQREDASLFEVIADPNLLKPENGTTVDDEPAKESSENNSTCSKAKKARIEEDDDDLEIIEDEEIADAEDMAGSSGNSEPAVASSSTIKSPPKKRKTGDEDGPSAKRSKVDSMDEDDDLILIDDD